MERVVMPDPFMPLQKHRSKISPPPLQEGDTGVVGTMAQASAMALPTCRSERTALNSSLEKKGGIVAYCSALPKVLVAVLLLMLACTGCGFYSFTGATIPEHLSTIAIPLAQDNTTSPLTNLNDALTQRLIRRFVGQTRLRLQPDEIEADAVLTATLDRYTNQPAGVSAEDRAALNRVTIGVTVVYRDQVQDEELLRRSFTGTADYDPVAAGLSGEETAADLALDNIADDVFTAATSNW